MTGPAVRRPFGEFTLETLAIPAVLWQPFKDKHAQLGGAPGRPVSPSALPEPAGAGSRVRYEHGTIYARRDGAAAWVYGDIEQRYEQLGAAGSWLGLPVTDEADFVEGGRVSVFERGAIYWWPDVGAIDVDEVVVHYTGLIAFGETDVDGDDTPFADEPYVVMAVTSPTGTVAVSSPVYPDVDAGETRPDLVEIYRGKPGGLVLAVQLMEHDFGNPDHFKQQVAELVEKAGPAIAKAVKYIPFVGPYFSDGLTLALPYIKQPITEFLNTLLDAGDNEIGRDVVVLSAKQLVVLAARTENSWHGGVGFKVQTQLLSGEGASYKAAFGMVAD